MTNGFAIFRPTERQQRTFALSPGGSERTVFLHQALQAATNITHLFSLAFVTQRTFRRFIPTFAWSFVVSQLFVILFIYCIADTFENWT